MPANLESNFNTKLSEVFLGAFDDERVLSKNVNTQLLTGKFNPSSGEDVEFKRQTDFTTVRTAKGDVSGETVGDIIAAKATGTVQDYFTVFVDFDEADEAIKMAQKGEPGEAKTLLGPMASRVVTDFELDFAAFMMKNTGLVSGQVGTAASSWSHIAAAGALMTSTGIPKDDSWYYTVNPFTQVALSEIQRSLGAGGSAGGLISEAQRKATITEDFAGMNVMTATTLASYRTHTVAGRSGALSANPDVTYVTGKDTMTQTLAVSGFGNNLQIRAGETVSIAGRNRLNLSTRKQILDESGAVIVFTGTVTTDVTLSGTGTGNITITGPAIFEANGAYNTVDSLPISGDIVTLLGSDDTIIQPNMFWHKQAFAVGSVPIKKLHSTDTIATTKDGLQIRVSKGADFLRNEQKVRIDFRPAYLAANPFYAGQGFGT